LSDLGAEPPGPVVIRDEPSARESARATLWQGTVQKGTRAPAARFPIDDMRPR
jgi:hypothetical protein